MQSGGDKIRPLTTFTSPVSVCTLHFLPPLDKLIIYCRCGKLLFQGLQSELRRVQQSTCCMSILIAYSRLSNWIWLANARARGPQIRYNLLYIQNLLRLTFIWATIIDWGPKITRSYQQITRIYTDYSIQYQVWPVSSSTNLDKSASKDGTL